MDHMSQEFASALAQADSKRCREIKKQQGDMRTLELWEVNSPAPALLKMARTFYIPSGAAVAVAVVGAAAGCQRSECERPDWLDHMGHYNWELERAQARADPTHHLSLSENVFHFER